MYVVNFLFFIKWVYSKILKCMVISIRVKTNFVKENHTCLFFFLLNVPSVLSLFLFPVLYFSLLRAPFFNDACFFFLSFLFFFALLLFIIFEI